MGAYGSPELNPRPPINDYPKVTYKPRWGISWSSVFRVFLWGIIIFLMLFIFVLLLGAYSALLL